MHFVKAKGILSAKMELICTGAALTGAFIVTPEANAITWNTLLKILKSKKMRLTC